MKSLVRLCCSCLPMLVCATLLSAAVVVTPAADESVLKPVGEGWQPLVNGSLDGWRAQPEYWKVEVDGTLHGTVLAGGVESMSNVEYYTTDMRWGARSGSVEAARPPRARPRALAARGALRPHLAA